MKIPEVVKLSFQPIFTADQRTIAIILARLFVLGSILVIGWLLLAMALFVAWLTG